MAKAPEGLASAERSGLAKAVVMSSKLQVRRWSGRQRGQKFGDVAMGGDRRAPVESSAGQGRSGVGVGELLGQVVAMDDGGEQGPVEDVPGPQGAHHPGC